MRGLLYALVALLAACNGATPSSSAPTTAQDPREVAAQEVPTSHAAETTRGATARPKGQAQATLPIGKLELESPPRAPVELKVEVAATDRQRQMGLMFREHLGENEGMFFVFESERRNSFWMRNTLIPLDMIFISADFVVVGVVENAEPLTDDPRGVPALSQYVLEVNAGYAKKHGVGPGTKVRFTPPEGT